MTPKEQRAYTEGQQRIARRVAVEALTSSGILSDDPVLDVARLSWELEETRRKVRELFERENVKWPGDKNWLPDIVEKDLVIRESLVAPLAIPAIVPALGGEDVDPVEVLDVPT